jgi:tRNA (mo5U34)-methyltransferase
MFGNKIHKTSATCKMSSAKPVAGENRIRLQQRINELGPWFHNFEIAQDVWTSPDSPFPGPDYPARRWEHVEPLFRDLSGKACLDVGCSSGFFSLKAKELGAASVLGVDSGEQIRAIEQARFASEALGLPVTFDTVSAYDLARVGGQFDVVFFLGVFYHLRHPLVALEAIRSICTGSMIF